MNGVYRLWGSLLGIAIVFGLLSLNEPAENAPAFAEDGLSFHFIATGIDGKCRPKVMRVAGDAARVSGATYRVRYSAPAVSAKEFSMDVDFNRRGRGAEHGNGLRIQNSQRMSHYLEVPCETMKVMVYGVRCLDANRSSVPCPQIGVSHNGGLAGAKAG